MKHTTHRPDSFTAVALGALLAVVLLVPATARATIIAYDGFATADDLVTLRGIDPYGAVNDLTTQSPFVPGYSGTWKDGTTATSQWGDLSVGLESSLLGDELIGGVQFDGSAGDSRAYRSLDGNPSGTTFYFGGLLQLDGNTDLTGTNLTGFIRNHTLSDSAFFNDSSATNVEGIMWGFQGDGSQIDLVMRVRQDVDGFSPTNVEQRYQTLASNVSVGDTHFVMFKLEMDVLSGPSGGTQFGNDRVSVWVDPTEITNQAAAGAPDYVFSNYALSGSDNLDRMTFASNDFANPVSYDENRLGTAWGDVAVRSQVVARDDFGDYSPGALTPSDAGPSANGGTGFGAGWSDTGADTDYFDVVNVTTPLAYAGQTAGSFGDAQALEIQGAGPERGIERPLAATESGDLYASFLLRWDTGFDQGDLVDFRFYSGGSQVARAGIKVDNDPGDGDMFAGTTSVSFSDFEFDPSEDHFVVLRVFRTGNGSEYNAITVWLDPDFTDYTSPDLTGTGATTFTSIDSFRIGPARSRQRRVGVVGQPAVRTLVGRRSHARARAIKLGVRAATGVGPVRRPTAPSQSRHERAVERLTPGISAASMQAQPR